MEFKTHWNGLGPNEKRDLAARCGTSVAYLSQVANGHRHAGRDLCFVLERETPLTRHEIRPDWFGPPPAEAPDQDRRTGRPDRREPAAYGRRVERDRRHGEPSGEEAA